MNGARSIFLRKGYWLTALAAIVLLAASPGTASAQVTVTGPDEVTEGGTATYTVDVKGYIQPMSQGGDLIVTLTATADDDPPATEGEPADISGNVLLTYTVTVEAGEEDDDPVPFSKSGGVIRVQTLDDLDAEDEDFTLEFAVTGVAGYTEDEAGEEVVDVDGDEPAALTIKDAQTQSYDLTTDDDDAKEGQAGPVTVTVTANPAHVNGSAMLTAQLDAPLTLASIAMPDGPSPLARAKTARRRSPSPWSGTTRTVSKTRSRFPCIRARWGIPRWLTHCPSTSKTRTRCLRSR